ncbi:hypothetical protein FPZ54_09365 [Sphingomonas suaedae]|uniref:Uncharacterized protein n=1 Tax=Sphingomonas suaedae TaxID=2599297 RepID=A0A518RFG1_9SPHN|nr:hypothetical protein [Sphingomonas suaedae]QDX26207.1 hypothetical protein FPZ54_09365 [Sphingomonas suaedae]
MSSALGRGQVEILRKVLGDLRLDRIGFAAQRGAALSQRATLFLRHLCAAFDQRAELAIDRLDLGEFLVALLLEHGERPATGGKARRDAIDRRSRAGNLGILRRLERFGAEHLGRGDRLDLNVGRCLSAQQHRPERNRQTFA